VHCRKKKLKRIFYRLFIQIKVHILTMGNKDPQLMYRCKIFDIWEEEVLLPDGKSTKQNWIDHKPTVAVAAVNDQSEILLIRQYRNSIKKNILEIPAGTMESTEVSPVICAQRELAEETGFQAGKFVQLFEGYLLPGYCNEYMYFFLARDLFAGPLPPDEDEFIEIIPTSFFRAKELLKQRDIIDVKTALGIILADNYISSGQFF
jgi:ADP-ribose pyrophosphatase